jgi:thymidylate kinase
MSSKNCLSFENEIKAVFDEFNKQDIRYAVIGDHGFIIEEKNFMGGDIKIGIRKGDLALMEEIFLNLGFVRFPLYPFLDQRRFIKYAVSSKALLLFHIYVDGITRKNLRYLDNKHHESLRLFRENILDLLWKLIWFVKSKPLISFIGMDGTGKTTVSHKVVEILKANNLKVTSLYGGRGKDNILPMIRFFREKKKRSRAVETEIDRNGKETGARGRYSLKQTVSASIFTLDQLLRYIFRILPLRKTNHFVLTERYGVDILLMEKIPMFLKRIMFSIVPRPTLVIYLYNDPKILSQRKRNHPTEDFRRQEKIFDQILPFINPVKIRSEDLHTTVCKVLVAIFNH